MDAWVDVSQHSHPEPNGQEQEPARPRSVEKQQRLAGSTAERRRQLAGTMSGGQQQILAIARALMSSPRLLLIDEPSVGLSPLLVSQVIAQIGELKRTTGLTVLMAEQNLAQAVRIADRGYVIVHGQIAFEGKSADELRSNDLVRELYLGEESAGGTGGAPIS